MRAPEAPICDYEGSDYQASFWEQGGRQYEDRVEAIALKRLLPSGGDRLLELGAGAGRNTPRYTGFHRVVLLDFSRTQLEQAKATLGTSPRYTYVAADVYRLPFIDGVFDAATMIRVLHHMTDAPRALSGVRDVLKPQGVFILEFANKRNLKAILRYGLRRQVWSPFAQTPIEFAQLNFNFHPRSVEKWLTTLGFRVQRRLTVSHFRENTLKRLIPLSLLVLVDSWLQPTGQLFQLTPSVFVRAKGGSVRTAAVGRDVDITAILKCPACGYSPLARGELSLDCSRCSSRWGMADGIFDFRRPIEARSSNSPV